MEDTNLDGVSSLAEIADLIDEPVKDQDDDAQQAEEQELPSDDEQQSEDDADADDDGEEVEYEGKAYKVPKELKEALLRQSDYTQKTQAVAEQRKSVEERAAMLEAKERVLSETFDKAVAVREVQSRLKQFENIDWQTLVDTDPVEATRLNIAYQQLQREAQAKGAELHQAQLQAQQLSHHMDQQTLAQEEKELKTRLPNFGKADSERIMKNLDAYGLTEQERKLAMHSAKFVHILHDAAIGREYQASGKTKTLQKVVEAPKVIKPQAAQPKPKQNQAAYDRLKKSGRVEDLAKLL
jgi:hypothetical protein